MTDLRAIHLLVPALLFAAPLAAQLPDRITPVARHHHPKQDLEVVTGTLVLPRALVGASLRPAPGEKGLICPLLLLEKPLDPADTRELIPFKVLALHRGSAPEGRLELLDGTGLKLADLRLAIPTLRSPDQAPLELWLRARAWQWGLRSATPSPLREALLASAASAYGLQLGLPESSRRERSRDSERSPSLLALLGGRAAVDETLQLDRPLRSSPGKPAAPPVALASLKGIETPAHPWATMRQAKPVPAPLALADCVPADRALLYLPKPKAALASLEGGGPAFLRRVSSFAGQGASDTTLMTRVLADLGLGNGRGRRMIESGAVKEALLFFPDLAFLSATEATVVAELAQASDGAFIPGFGVHAFQTQGGEAFAARRGTRIFLSTSRAELEAALRLSEGGGKGSLGRSDELAVVLGELPPGADTEVWAYLPDAFIRGLVGPRQRILQARQAQARADMEALAGAALLRHLDAPDEPLSLARLKSLGYLPKELDLRDLTLETNGRVRHAVYGPLERLEPLARLPLTQVDPGEAASYTAFRESYSEYWPRYFDPIALRLDAHADGQQNLETFVLPLLDSTIYSPLRAMLGSGEALPQPVWNQPMVAELGLRVSFQGLYQTRISRSLETWEKPLADNCTGVLAIAFPDSAPVLQLGGGNPATLFDAGNLTRGGLLGAGALALGAFTRPMVVALELKDPELTRKALAGLGPDALPLSHRDFDELEEQLTREPDGRLLARLGLLGLVNMRFTAHVEDRWLVLSNDASLPSPLLSASRTGDPFSAAFSLHPGALKLGLSAAFMAAMEGEAASAFTAMDWLAPWLQASGDVKAAQAECHRLLGSAPILDPQALVPGQRLKHRVFGVPDRRTSPVLDPAKDFGLLEGIPDALVEMRMEGDGLRARVSWKAK